MYKVGNIYNDLRSRLNPADEYTRWLTYIEPNGNRMASVNIYRGVKYLNFLDQNKYPFAAAFIFETSKTSKSKCNKAKGEFNNPWTDEFIDNANEIKYWGDAKYHQTKEIHDWLGCRKIKLAIQAINKFNYIPPVLHFTRINKGKMLFNGIYGIKKISIEKFLDVEYNTLVENYLVELKRLETDIFSIDWIHNKVHNFDYAIYPIYWQDYLSGLKSIPINLPISIENRMKYIESFKLGSELKIDEFVRNSDFLGLYSYLNLELKKRELFIPLNELRDLTISYFSS